MCIRELVVVWTDVDEGAHIFHAALQQNSAISAAWPTWMKRV